MAAAGSEKPILGCYGLATSSCWNVLLVCGEWVSVTRDLTPDRLHQACYVDLVMKRMKTRSWFQQFGLEYHHHCHRYTVRSEDLKANHEPRSGRHRLCRWGMSVDVLLTMACCVEVSSEQQLVIMRTYMQSAWNSWPQGKLMTLLTPSTYSSKQTTHSTCLPIYFFHSGEMPEVFSCS